MCWRQSKLEFERLLTDHVIKDLWGAYGSILLKYRYDGTLDRYKVISNVERMHSFTEI